MTTWTAHLRADRPPVLIAEGFSWGAALFGPFWLLAHRAWIPAVLTVAATIAIEGLAPGALATILQLALGLLLGLSGRDLCRWSVTLRGYLLTNVLQARSEDEAMARLLTARPDLLNRSMPAGSAR